MLEVCWKFDGALLALGLLLAGDCPGMLLVWCWHGAGSCLVGVHRHARCAKSAISILYELQYLD